MNGIPLFYYKFLRIIPLFYYKTVIFVPLFYYKDMINRNIISDLREWRKRKNQKPLVLRGARQVGKTTLVLRHILKTGWKYAAQRIKFERFGESDYRSREVGEAFRLLEKAMLLEIAYPYSDYQIPILPELKRSPKLFWLDTGIVNYVARIQKEVFSVQDITDTWRGKVAEHIVGQELLAGKTDFFAQRNFWVRKANSSDAEVDFIIQHDNRIIPVEVKSGHNSKLRSLHLFMDEVDHQTAIRIWSGKYSIDKVTTPKGKTFYLYNLPYYYAGILESLLINSDELS